MAILESVDRWRSITMFFEENVYKMFCDPNLVDLENLSMNEHWTRSTKNERYGKQTYQIQEIHHQKQLQVLS